MPAIPISGRLWKDISELARVAYETANQAPKRSHSDLSQILKLWRPFLVFRQVRLWYILSSSIVAG